MALCRCGASKYKPFCDAATASPVSSTPVRCGRRSRPRPMRGRRRARDRAQTDGPLVLTGPLTLARDERAHRVRRRRRSFAAAAARTTSPTATARTRRSGSSPKRRRPSRRIPTAVIWTERPIAQRTPTGHEYVQPSKQQTFQRFLSLLGHYHYLRWPHRRRMPSASAFDAEATKFYEDAIARLEEDDVAGAIIQLNNAMQKDPSMLAAQLVGYKRGSRTATRRCRNSFEKALQLGAIRRNWHCPRAGVYSGRASTTSARTHFADGLPRPRPRSRS